MKTSDIINANLFGGIFILVFYIGGNLIKIPLNSAQQQLIESELFINLFVFGAAYCATKNIYQSFLLFLFYILIYKILTNNKSKLNILPNKLIKAIDRNKDGIIDENEINDVLKLLIEKKNKLLKNKKNDLKL